MEFLKEYIAMWKNYANFKDRTTVRGYWMAFVVNILVGVVINVLTMMISIFGIVGGLYSLAALIPGIAICIRRLHDIGKSGWYWLVGLIPLVGWIILIVWFVKPSVNENNPYESAQTV
ncbi:DUF805 domain-containing protein [Anaerotruncus rubiinfantis]|uniref:DUF805 domain-containing protein n=1 Tax=Anaerotruncus rubiinfantis TaxID=1720200 RepID=UPI0034A19691